MAPCARAEVTPAALSPAINHLSYRCSSRRCRLFSNSTTTTDVYTLSLHDALPICPLYQGFYVYPSLQVFSVTVDPLLGLTEERSEEHTSELQSQSNLVCRLLLEKKKVAYT